LGPGPVILVAVGTQFPFDRLVKTVDNWATTSGATDVIAQIGPSSYVPTAIQAHAFLPPAEFEALLERADLVVAHCGMGSILSALSHGKPIVVMPRSAAKGEHRNDHQHATAQRFSRRPGVTVAWDEADLLRCLEGISNHGSEGPHIQPIQSKAPRQLTDRLRAFLFEGKR
jgi:UDP-N-acetylglucosamine transferase subunit ALG13